MDNTLGPPSVYLAVPFDQQVPISPSHTVWEVYYGSVWIRIILCMHFQRFLFFFFFLFFQLHTFQEIKLLFMHCSYTIHALFIRPTTTLLKKNTKNESHSIIHLFKNYFFTVFSVLSFQQNKLYLNEPYIFK